MFASPFTKGGLEGGSKGREGGIEFGHHLLSALCKGEIAGPRKSYRSINVSNENL
jgi:hypothetical protein